MAAQADDDRRNFYIVLSVLVVLLVIIMAIGIGGGSCSTSTKSNEGLAACTHFRNVASDQTRGVLTDAQLLAKMQEVAGSAPPGSQIQRSADRAVRGLIDNDETEAANGVRALGKACDDAGF